MMLATTPSFMMKFTLIAMDPRMLPCQQQNGYN
jgi:hypothetical protein